MFTRGGMDAARMALDRSLAIAEEHGDARDQLQILGPLHMFHLRTGGFNIALGYARRCSDIAKAQKDSAATILAHALMGMSLHLGGDLRAARVELESALRSEEHTSELQSLMRISYAVFCLKKKKITRTAKKQ